jgi:hypothetical protein
MSKSSQYRLEDGEAGPFEEEDDMDVDDDEEGKFRDTIKNSKDVIVQTSFFS